MENLKMGKQNKLTQVLFIIYILALTWLILFKLQFSIPVMKEGRAVNLIPLLGSFNNYGVIRFAEIRFNILAFIPLGVYICMLKTKWSFEKKVLAIIVLALAFEITQFIFAIGRVDITDVISNTLGEIVGIGIYALLFKVLKGRTDRLINVLAAVFTSLALLLVAFLLVSHRWLMKRARLMIPILSSQARG